MQTTFGERILFCTVGKHSNFFPLIEKIYREYIAPVYGEQETVLQKIGNAEDRTCEIMLHNYHPVGFIVYKNDLQEEFGLTDSFELKTIRLFCPERDGRKGFGSQLYKRVEWLAHQKKAKTAHVTVSSKLPDAFNHTAKNGYVSKEHKTYQDGSILYLFIKQIKAAPIWQHRDLENLSSFLHFAEGMKTELRNGQTSKKRHESVADHTFRMTLMLTLFERFLTHPISVEKALKMVVVHDLCELVTGDEPYFVCEDKHDKKREKRAAEKGAMLEIKSMLPKAIGEEFLQLWLEYEAMETTEAKVVKALDKLEAQIQHNEMDFSRWNEYDFKYAFTRLNKYCDFDSFLRDFRIIVQEESQQKLRDNHMTPREILR